MCDHHSSCLSIWSLLSCISEKKFLASSSTVALILSRSSGINTAIHIGSTISLRKQSQLLKFVFHTSMSLCSIIISLSLVRVDARILWNAGHIVTVWRMSSTSSWHRRQVGSTLLLLNKCLLDCNMYTPVRNRPFMTAFLTAATVLDWLQTPVTKYLSHILFDNPLR